MGMMKVSGVMWIIQIPPLSTVTCTTVVRRVNGYEDLGPAGWEKFTVARRIQYCGEEWVGHSLMVGNMGFMFLHEEVVQLWVTWCMCTHVRLCLRLERPFD